MGLLSRTPNGELETEAMIAVDQRGLKETMGQAAVAEMERSENASTSQPNTPSRLVGEGQHGASFREEFTGTKQTPLDATTMRQKRLPRGEIEDVVEVRLTDFGGRRLNAA